MVENNIQIHGLQKQFQGNSDYKLIIDDAIIPKGKITGIVGPDGAGKTTFMRILAGLLSFDFGSITIFGKDIVKDFEQIRHGTGYMPQKFGLYEDLTVRQNLNLYAELRGLSKDEKGEVFKKLMHFTALEPFQSRLVKNLSGGMKQKLGLACALIKKPALLLLDEPSVGVDPVSRRELWKMVQALIDQDVTIVWSTAYLDEAERCQNVLLLNEGKLLYQGDPKLLTERLKNRVFMISPKESDKREELFKCQKKDEIIDALIQGNLIRVVLKKDKTLLGDFQASSVLPRFEDAFIDILGGGGAPDSKLADCIEKKEEKEHFPIVAKNLTKLFNTFTAVNNVSIEVKMGEVFGLLGPNGAGKTTIFKMLCGLLQPSAGKTFVNGLNLQKSPDIARMNIGYMAQKFSLYGNLSVQQNLDFFAGMYSLKNHKKKAAIEEMIDVFKLEKYLSTNAEKLPLGYKQRLSLACANMHRPSILFLDEPTSGVDPLTRREFWNHINGLVRKGVTIMITTHFMEEAEYCDRIAFIYQGKIIKIASSTEVKQEVVTDINPNPTLEDAFIAMIENYNGEIDARK